MKYAIILLSALLVLGIAFFGCGGAASTQQGSVDEDNDGMLDVWELQYFASIEECNPDDDSDGDTKTNLEEFLDRTDPTRAVSVDLDGDGIDDEWELIYFSTIAECNPNEDPDGDGLTNLQEYQGGSDPTDRQDPYADPTPGPGLEIPEPVETRYIDNTIGVDFSTSYDPGTRNVGSGSQTVYRTFAGACAVAQPGWELLIRGGTYNERFVPQTSGTSGAYIHYRAYSGETPVITVSLGGYEAAVDISNRSYLVMDGLMIDNVEIWLHALNTHHCVLINNHFRNAWNPGRSEKTGLFFQEADYNYILDNIIDDCSEDNLTFIKSDRNLVQGNTFTEAYHTLWCIKGGNFNVMRGNYFYNGIQKIGEIYDPYNVGYDPDEPDIKIYFEKDVTKYNLIENNEFQFTPSSENSSPYSGIQYSAQHGIIRYNFFYDTVGPGFSLTLYGDEANYNYSNRIYNNVFYNSEFAGVSVAGSGYTFYDNILRNNIIYASSFVANDTRWPWYTMDLAGKPVQIKAGRLDGFLFENNTITYNSADETYLFTYGNRADHQDPPYNFPTPHTISWYESNNPELFKDNLFENPLFVNAPAYNFSLNSSSPMRNAGMFLTKTVGTGNDSMSMQVEDAGYFYDGYDIPGEVGDAIKIEGQYKWARVIDINYGSNVLVLDYPLSWSSGQGVSVYYYGTAPDMGAIEYEE